MNLFIKRVVLTTAVFFTAQTLAFAESQDKPHGPSSIGNCTMDLPRYFKSDCIANLPFVTGNPTITKIEYNGDVDLWAVYLDNAKNPKYAGSGAFKGCNIFKKCSAPIKQIYNTKWR